MFQQTVVTGQVKRQLQETAPATTFEIFSQISRSPTDFHGLEENALSHKSISNLDYRTNYIPSKH
jgi:hypothetical protein